jgi:hypothetical protein
MYSNEIGPGPLQVPAVAVKVCPSMGVPEMVGRDVFSGLPSETIALGAEVAVAEPSELVAITVTRNLWLESTTSRPRAAFVLNGLLMTQLLPFVSQRSHW